MIYNLAAATELWESCTSCWR